MIDSRMIIKQYGLVPNKALGQNFLVEFSAIKKIAGLADCAGAHVLEIGPGLGALTDLLCSCAASVCAVEIDKKMVEILSSILAGTQNLKLINRDFLRLTNSELYSAVGEKPFIVAANLPYYITTPAIMKLVDSDLPIKRMVLMMQQEASDHFFAEPRTKLYSPLTILCRHYYSVRCELTLPPSCYYPEPSVHSVVLSFERNDNEYDPSLSKLLKVSFAMRRKTLRNNLSTYISKDSVLFVIEAAGLNPSCRAEELSVDDFVRLNDSIKLL